MATSSVDHMVQATEAEGWYEDPYGVHQHRWFSAGKPSGLVRDGGIETTDRPPDEPFEGPLVRATSEPATNTGSNLGRAGGRQGDAYDPLKAFDAVLDGNSGFLSTEPCPRTPMMLLCARAPSRGRGRGAARRSGVSGRRVNHRVPIGRQNIQERAVRRGPPPLSRRVQQSRRTR